MKVIIQIPAYNEESALPVTLAALPRSLDGVDEIEWLVIDDGSVDNTVQTAIEGGTDYVISHRNNLGLAQAFLSGIMAALYFGADIIVNTDADNQYCAEDIQKLIEPIVQGKAEYVVGTRPIKDIEHWSYLKKRLQFFGSWVVRKIARADVEDAPSGFRALTRAAAMRLHVFNHYTYTLETIIQAGHMKIPIVCIPVQTNDEIRPSRLMHNMIHYLQHSFSTIIRSFVTYDPLRFFLAPGLTAFMFTFALGVRYLYFRAIGEGSGHVQSLILALAIMLFGMALLIVGLLADLVSVNRRLLENVDYRLHMLDLELNMQKERRLFNRAYLVYHRGNKASLW